MDTQPQKETNPNYVHPLTKKVESLSKQLQERDKRIEGLEAAEKNAEFWKMRFHSAQGELIKIRKGEI